MPTTSTAVYVKAVQKVYVNDTANAINVVHPGGAKAIFIVRNAGLDDIKVYSGTVIAVGSAKTVSKNAPFVVVDTSVNILLAAAGLFALVTVESQPAPTGL